MENYIKPSYLFYDIYIFRKSDTGYVNLSDFDIAQHIESRDEHKFPETAEYLIGLQTADSFIISPITIDEIVKLAGLVPETHFIRQCKSNIDDNEGDDIVAVICAKRIINYNHGKIKRNKDVNGIVFDFYRRRIVSQKPVWKTEDFVVLEKSFMRIK